MPIHISSEILSDIVTWCGTYITMYGSDRNLISTASSDMTNNAVNGASAVSYTSINKNDDSQAFSSVGILTQHETFYCSVQAACYILCFHGIELASQQRISSCLRSDWEKIFTSSLEPLKYCFFSVRVEFLKLVLFIGLLREEVWNKISFDIIQPYAVENNLNSSDLNVKSSKLNSASIAQRSNPLDSFFPFDPCLLQSLHSFVDVYYRHWAGVPGLIEENDMQTGYADTDTDMMSSSMSSSLLSSIPRDSMAISQQYDSFPGESLIRSISSHSRMIGHSSAISISTQVSDASEQFQNPFHNQTQSPSLNETVESDDVDEHGYKRMTRHESLCHKDEMLSLPLGPDGWPLPLTKQARHYSMGSNGSW